MSLPNYLDKLKSIRNVKLLILVFRQTTFKPTENWKKGTEEKNIHVSSDVLPASCVCMCMCVCAPDWYLLPPSHKTLVLSCCLDYWCYGSLSWTTAWCSDTSLERTATKQHWTQKNNCRAHFLFFPLTPDRLFTHLMHVSTLQHSMMIYNTVSCQHHWNCNVGFFSVQQTYHFVQFYILFKGKDKTGTAKNISCLVCARHTLPLLTSFSCGWECFVPG